jgi:molybdopterin biosynthesis enzyme
MPVEDALERLLDMAAAAPIREQERLALAACDGRVLAQDLISTLDLPPWPNSAMDGYALRRADWTGEPWWSASASSRARRRSRWPPVPARGSSPVRRCLKARTA